MVKIKMKSLGQLTEQYCDVWQRWMVCQHCFDAMWLLLKNVNGLPYQCVCYLRCMFRFNRYTWSAFQTITRKVVAFAVISIRNPFLQKLYPFGQSFEMESHIRTNQLRFRYCFPHSSTILTVPGCRYLLAKKPSTANPLTHSSEPLGPVQLFGSKSDGP